MIRSKNMCIKYTVCLYLIFRIVYSKLECKNSNNLNDKLKCAKSNYIPDKEKNISDISHNNCSSLTKNSNSNKRICRKITKKVIKIGSNPSTDRFNDQKSSVTYVPTTTKKLPSNRLAYITSRKTNKDNLISKKNLSLKIFPSNLEENLRKKIKLGVIPYAILNPSHVNNVKNGKDFNFYEEKPENLFILNNELNYYYNYNFKNPFTCRGVSGMSGKCRGVNYKDNVYMVSRCNKVGDNSSGNVYKVSSLKNGFNEEDCDEGSANDGGNFVKVTTLKESVNDKDSIVKVSSLKGGVNDRVSRIKWGLSERGSNIGVNAMVSSIKRGFNDIRSNRGVNTMVSNIKGGFNDIRSVRGVNAMVSSKGGLNEQGNNLSVNDIESDRSLNEVESNVGVNDIGTIYGGVDYKDNDIKDSSINEGVSYKDKYFNSNIYRLGNNEDDQWFRDYLNHKRRNF